MRIDLMDLFEEKFQDIREDLWQYLSHTEKPIVLYGMGDGADKILNILEERSVAVSGVFASDGFVRKKVYRGFIVTSYAEICVRFPDCIVLVCFGSKLPDVLENIKKIASERELYAPDVPVYGGGLFTLSYFRENLSRLAAVYERLCDENSKNTFVRSIRYRLTGNISELFACESRVEESYRELICPQNGSIYVDIGAYNGDTVEEYRSFAGDAVTVYAFEPDRRNFRKLTAYSAEHSSLSMHLYNAAALESTGPVAFFSRSGRGCGKTTSHTDAKAETVDGLAADDVVPQADHIKIDAEGSDRSALTGARRLIQSGASLCVAAYHRTEDYFVLPETVFAMNDEYRLYFRHFPYIPCWDTNFYFIPKQK